MKIKSLLTVILTLIALGAATGGGYALARLMPDIGSAASPNLPPLTRLDLPSQTQNGITVTLESYYADASRFVFKVKATNEEGDAFLDHFSLKDESGIEINSSGGSNSEGTNPFRSTIEFDPIVPINTERFKGKLTFASVTSIGDGEVIKQFSFDLDLPIHPALTFNPKQTIWANGVEILLDRLIITPAYTQAYLCYIRPTDADWTIGYGTTLLVNGRVATVGTYGLLFDSAYGDGSKGGEPGWTPPIDNGRCVKIGFPIGDEHPDSLVLTIPALEQSPPEVIPDDDLARAYEILQAQGIDMEWHTVDHGAYPEYKKLPAGMREYEAYRQFIEALGYIHPGGWTFELVLNAKENSQPKFSTSSYGAATPIPFTNEIKPVLTMQGRVRSFDLSPDTKTIAFATSKGIVLSDLDGNQVRVLNNNENFFSVDWSPDGSKLAAGSIRMNADESGIPHVIVWDSAAWESMYETKGEQEASIPFGTVAWSPNGKSLAASLHDRGLAIIDVGSGKIIAQLDDFLLPSDDMAWSRDGSRLLATGDLGFGFRRWRLDTNETVRLYDPRAGSAAIQLAWSPDGTRIASGHAGGTVCFWTVSTNQCDGLIYAHQNMVSSLAWSPDGSKLATGGGVIRIWDTQTGQLLTAFGLNEKAIYKKLAWLEPDLLISLETGYASDAPTIVRFWDLTTGNVLTEFEGQSGSFGG